MNLQVSPRKKFKFSLMATNTDNLFEHKIVWAGILEIGEYKNFY